MSNQSAFTVGGGTGGGSGSQIVVSVNQVAHGLSQGDIIRSDGTSNSFIQAQADTAVNAEVVGIVTGVIDPDNFTYSKDIMNYNGSGIPAGTPGNAVFLSPSTPGAMTMTEPSSVGQIVKPIGILISSGSLLNFSSDIRGEILNPSSGGGFINPAVSSTLFDDFIGGGDFDGNIGVTGVKVIGELGWRVNDIGSFAEDSTFVDNNHPGIIAISSGTGTKSMYLDGHISDLNAPNSTYTFEVKVGSTADAFYCGITNNIGGSDTGTDTGLTFKLVGTNWQGRYNDGGGEVFVGSIPATTDFVQLRLVVNSTGNTAEWFVDGVSLGTQAIIASGNGMRIAVVNYNGAGGETDYIDYFFFNRQLTR